MNWTKISTRTLASLAAVAFAVVVAAAPAQAGDAIFPTGSRIGLVPPLNMPLSPHFMGFEDTQGGAAILLSTFPGDAFHYLDNSMVPEALKKQGIDKREPFTARAGTGFLLSGKQTVGTTSLRKWMLIAPAENMTALVTVRAPEDSSKYTDQVIRAALATVAARPQVPDAEQLSLLPFKVGDLAGFHIDDVLPGRAVMLVDRPAGADQSAKPAQDPNKDLEGQAVDARFLIAALPGGPTDAKDNDNFARVTFAQISGIGDVRVQDAEPLRIGGQSGYETMATAKDAQGTKLMVVQWLRFGSGGYMQMTAISHADLWPGMLMRLRKIRDSINAE
ncbi:MAG TPA: hypothetical protein VL048_07465 [Xanthobacteraceae bacterium]|nr:hypothetical protein [Xanthobacteraceae bacterium]